MIKIISNFINSYFHIFIGILWIMIRHRILVNFKEGEISALLTVKIRVEDIPDEEEEELELIVKKYYLYHLIQYGLEALIIMIVLKPVIINIDISGGGSLWI